MQLAVNLNFKMYCQSQRITVKDLKTSCNDTLIYYRNFMDASRFVEMLLNDSNKCPENGIDAIGYAI